jgi:hypothetical protein
MICDWKELTIPEKKEDVKGFLEKRIYSIRGIYEDNIEVKPSSINPKPRSERPLVLVCDYEHTT